VSVETVQDIVLWIYKASLRIQYFLGDLFSWQDAKLTVKAIILISVSMALSFLVGDALFLWLVADVCLLWPLIIKKKRAEVDRIMGLVNLKIDEVVSKLPFIKGVETKRRASISVEGKKQL
jgi:hypothetical protein